MKRLCLTVACLAGAVAWSQALAQDLSASPAKPAKAHEAKAKHLAAKPAGLADNGFDAVRFSDPYAPPEGATTLSKRADLVKRSNFPVSPYPSPKEPHGGLTISMGKDGGGHTTGGLGWSF